MGHGQLRLDSLGGQRIHFKENTTGTITKGLERDPPHVTSEKVHPGKPSLQMQRNATEGLSTELPHSSVYSCAGLTIPSRLPLSLPLSFSLPGSVALSLSLSLSLTHTHTHSSLLLNMERKCIVDFNSLKKISDMKRWVGWCWWWWWLCGASNPLSDLKHSWRNNRRSTAGTNKIAPNLVCNFVLLWPSSPAFEIM